MVTVSVTIALTCRGKLIQWAFFIGWQFGPCMRTCSKLRETFAWWTPDGTFLTWWTPKLVNLLGGPLHYGTSVKLWQNPGSPCHPRRNAVRQCFPEGGPDGVRASLPPSMPRAGRCKNEKGIVSAFRRTQGNWESASNKRGTSM